MLPVLRLRLRFVVIWVVSLFRQSNILPVLRFVVIWVVSLFRRSNMLPVLRLRFVVIWVVSLFRRSNILPSHVTEPGVEPLHF
jgi:hypothetical protein